MRTSILCGLLAVITACGSSTDAGPVRYNFAVIDGKNQISTAGDATLGKRVTAQLTRDPQGQFASRALDFLLPTKAYAQGLSLAGEPMADQIVCAREAGPGEPEAVPLCAFTLADGTAPITINGGTKAGVFVVTFTAQVQSQEPVMDSTTVTVEAGPMTSHAFVHGNSFGCWTLFPALNVQDQFGNAVPYRFVTQGPYAHVGSGEIGTEAGRTFVPDAGTDPSNSQQFQVVAVETAGGVIATGKLTAPSFPSQSCVSLAF